MRGPLIGAMAGACLALVAAAALIAASAGLDGYLRRGGVWGNETATLRPTRHLLAANTFLHLEVEPAKVDRTARLLRAAGITMVRQQFPWNEIEPQRGQYVDQRSGQSSWLKYDYFVQALAREGITILARIENTPVWARPGQETTAHPFGPPTDYGEYARFVSEVVGRYRGRITAVQVWNEPNLAGEWGGRPPDAVAYVDLLRRAQLAMRAIDPEITVVAAGLAPTDGLTPGAVNELDFLEQMYGAGARDVFDVMGVMIYGLGQSPDNRHVGYRFPINLSRPAMTRDVMLRHDDGLKPVWALEYGYIAVPDDWRGRPSTWGPSLTEQQQATYLMRGLERMRAEWPWLGVVSLWAFRFVESTLDPADPQRFFALVGDDFSPRPAYLALVEQADHLVARPGVYSIDDPLIRLAGRWESQRLAGRSYRLAGGAGATMRLRFEGDRLVLQARRSADGGRLAVLLDGQPLSFGSQASLALDGPRTVDVDLLLVDGLTAGQHTLELRALDDGALAISGLIVARDRPFGWAFTWLHAVSLLLLLWAWRGLVRLLLLLLGYLPTLRLPGDWRRHGWQ